MKREIPAKGYRNIADKFGKIEKVTFARQKDCPQQDLKKRLARPRDCDEFRLAAIAKRSGFTVRANCRRIFGSRPEVAVGQACRRAVGCTEPPPWCCTSRRAGFSPRGLANN